MRNVFWSLVVGASALVFPLFVALAHEGHNELPGVLRAVHGGIIKPGKNINMELVADGGKLAFYPIAHAGDNLDTNQLKIEAKVKDPKGRVALLKLSKNVDIFSGEIDFKGNLRNEVEIKSNYKGSVDIFTFQVEKP